MFFQIIESSSAGNCSLLRCGGKNILIDAGVGIRKVEAYLGKLSLSPADIDAIFITHEHGDHCKALSAFSKYPQILVFANRLTAESIIYSIPNVKKMRWQIFQNGVEFLFEGICVTAFSVPHDTGDCVGYSFRFDSQNLVWATDCGKPTKLLFDVVHSASLLILESNYCPIMLENSPRPYRLKERIRSSHGHLSNAQAIQILKTLDPSRVHKIFLAHVSAECNNCEHIAQLLFDTPELAQLIPLIEVVPPLGSPSSIFES